MTFEEWWQKQNVLPNADGWDRSIKHYAEKAWNVSLRQLNIRNIDLGDNSLLIITVPQGCDKSFIEELAVTLKSQFTLLNNKSCSVVVSDDIQIKCLDEQQMNESGWYRKEE